MTKKETVKFHPEKGEISILGRRGVLIDMALCCEKLDNMLGSGAEVVLHHMWYGYGYQLFDSIIEKKETAVELKALKKIVKISACMGLGSLDFTIIGKKRPYVEVAVKNPPFKNEKGSAKRSVASFWAGVFSRYFEKKVTCEDFHYDKKEDVFSFTLRQT
jgi:hypothetical protein